MNQCIVYIGDFDFRNENVQAHLVKNNGKIFTSLGYRVEYIGMNRNCKTFREINSLPPYSLEEEGRYLELPDTLSISGLIQTPKVCKKILERLDEIRKQASVLYVITYQSPTYAIAIEKIAKWCKKNGAYYIVNCADLPIFDLQSPLRKVVMRANWNYMHKIHQKYADGVIAVSQFIRDYYQKPGRKSVVIPPLFHTDSVSPNFVPNPLPTFIYAGTPFKLTGREAAPEGMKDRLDRVIDLFLHLSSENIPYHFDIVGIIKEDYIAGVPRQAAALKEEKNIHFLGRRSHKETLQMVKQADFSINYRDENLMTKAGFSTKIVESVSMGTPVIINNISDTFLYLKDGRDSFMLSGNLKKDLETVKGLCAITPEERLQLRQNLFNEKLFDLTKYADALDAFFHSFDNAERN